MSTWVASGSRRRSFPPKTARRFRGSRSKRSLGSRMRQKTRPSTPCGRSARSCKRSSSWFPSPPGSMCRASVRSPPGPRCAASSSSARTGAAPACSPAMRRCATPTCSSTATHGGIPSRRASASSKSRVRPSAGAASHAPLLRVQAASRWSRTRKTPSPRRWCYARTWGASWSTARSSPAARVRPSASRLPKGLRSRRSPSTAIRAPASRRRRSS
mmetsp:Transcript_81840/g.236553  ORF Transcript_81840/g.236553 Transcript_81840/m.236553 type:complete len:215 (-) Transcript_81840:50-694(-)